MIGVKRQFNMAGGVWREMPKRHFRLRSLALMLATAGFVYALYARVDIKPVTVKIADVVSKDMPVYIDAQATVQANQTVTVRAQAEGQLTEILFKEGQEVKAGDVLARLDPRTYQSQYDEAVANKIQDEAMLAKAKDELLKSEGRPRSSAKTAKVVGHDIEAKRSVVRQFEATVKSDDVAIETLKMQLSRSVITSPIDGRAGLRQIDVGNRVGPGDANGLVVITQMQPITIMFNLPQKNLPDLRLHPDPKDNPKVLAVDTDNHTLLDTGVIDMIDNQIDPVGGTIRLKAVFPNVKRTLWPGESVHVRVLAATRGNATVIPASALYPAEPKPVVYVYNQEKDKVERRPVKVAMTQDDMAVIEEGVKPGEKLVSDSMEQLSDGSRVTLSGNAKGK